MSTFTQEKVKWEIRGNLTSNDIKADFIPLNIAEQIALLHDETEDFYTVECAAELAIERYQSRHDEDAA